ncbi:S-adenosyl-L-methionine-dependent methyltransferase [Thelephora ganbajun]|uniref:S-adenosyl-L-methionine-dependent methyltransferase n=1 Tax=Thelephora ganbajun TaxID=370292 RepID=A0ACB6ZVV0_THEGA|nr:S-adenosyl-L-methionine-dependent methyltransferase [Thelephora ganbajun]
MGYHLPSCMRFLEASHAVEIIREAGPAGLHIKELAARVDCDPNKLGHILRLLATHHIGKEVSPNIFANNRLSSFIDSGKDFKVIKANPAIKYGGTNGIAAFVGMCTDELFKSSAYLTDAYLLEEISKHSSLPSAAPFNLAFRMKGQFFSWLEEEGNEMRLKRFGHAMTGTAGWEDGGSVSQADGFDWAGLEEGSLVVDVGGGIGSTSMTLARAFPHLRFRIQDRPKTVELGIAAWKERCPEMLESGRAVFQAHDFFTPQPVQNAAVFLLRVITHDWPDEFVTRILLQLRHAATPQTRLILVDYVLPLACEDRTEDIGAIRTMAPPSSGLLPNLGKANANAFWLDMTMHVIFNSKERTLREMTDIALSAGWQVTNVIRKPEGSLFGSIIAVPISIPPSKTLLSAVVEQEIVERSVSPVGDTFYSHSRLPSSPKAVGITMSQSDSAMRRMTQRLRKTISKTFTRTG